MIETPTPSEPLPIETPPRRSRRRRRALMEPPPSETPPTLNDRAAAERASEMSPSETPPVEMPTPLTIEPLPSKTSDVAATNNALLIDVLWIGTLLSLSIELRPSELLPSEPTLIATTPPCGRPPRPFR